MAQVVAVCVSEAKGTQKRAVPEIRLRKGHGIEGDAHAGDWHRQVSLLGEESAENILTQGVTLYELPIGTRLRIGDALLKVTQIGKECHAGCAIRSQGGDCVMPREGIFAVVLEEGTVRAGDTLDVIPPKVGC